MPQTLTHLLYHLVFSTHKRLPLITNDIREPLYEYLGGIIRNERGKLLEVGGMQDHIHILARFPARRSVSDMLRLLKSESSRWLNERQGEEPFGWQKGYGAFTVSPSQLATIRRYIQNQEVHHQDRAFEAEFLALLKKHDIEYDERYLWD